MADVGVPLSCWIQPAARFVFRHIACGQVVVEINYLDLNQHYPLLSDKKKMKQSNIKNG